MLSKSKNKNQENIHLDKDKQIDILDIYNFSMFKYDEKNFQPKKEFYQNYFGKNKKKK